MSGSTRRMVSRIARPAVIEPPGELMYSEISRLRILGGQEQHLGDDQVGHVVVNGRAQENNVLLQQARIDVEGAFASRRLLDHHRHEYGIVHPKLSFYYQAAGQAPPDRVILYGVRGGTPLV